MIFSLVIYIPLCIVTIVEETVISPLSFIAEFSHLNESQRSVLVVESHCLKILMYVSDSSDTDRSNFNTTG